MRFSRLTHANAFCTCIKPEGTKSVSCSPFGPSIRTRSPASTPGGSNRSKACDSFCSAPSTHCGLQKRIVSAASRRVSCGSARATGVRAARPARRESSSKKSVSETDGWLDTGTFSSCFMFTGFIVACSHRVASSFRSAAIASLSVQI